MRLTAVGCNPLLCDFALLRKVQRSRPARQKEQACSVNYQNDYGACYERGIIILQPAK